MYLGDINTCGISKQEQVSFPDHLITASHLKSVMSVKLYPLATDVNREVCSRRVGWGKPLGFATVGRVHCLLYAQMLQKAERGGDSQKDKTQGWRRSIKTEFIRGWEIKI